ncbi:unnamed protein product [Adineta ricciae]|uniref:alpha-L-fucosidase n=1 Tax=Adineta ricciae TaxID=249248 RepID=A0A813ZSI2_ADIRI|nr:unnamed protein product [Adineta ricciae]CAF1198511.1 unnamed protein product [Adineta ricciae]
MSVIFTVLILCSLSSWSEQQYTSDWTSLDARPLPKWYDESKIGIFIHWGLYSVPAISSEWMWWNWKGDNPSQVVVDYMKANYPPDWTYANFGPEFRADLYDPNEWADLFAASGAKYIVFTSKHHEGYTMWPSTFSFNWNSMHVGPKRDLLGDLASAIRNRTNLVFGLYYSLFEWFNPLYLRDKSTNFTSQDYAKTKTMPELKEIVETYKPEIVWSDGEWEPLDTYWSATQFLAWLYNDSPVKDTVVTNDRWGSGTLCKHGGFYTCLDRYNPGHLVEHKWENCFTIDKRSWAYRPIANIDDYMTIEEVIREIVITISTGGNALVNVGPNRHGKIPPIFQERLQQMGSWLKVNGEGIYASVPWKYQNDTINSDIWYTSSKDGRYVYAFLLMWPKNITEITLGAPLPSANTVVTMLGSNDRSIPWKVGSDNRGMMIDISNVKLHLLESQWVWVFRLTDLLTDNATMTTIQRTTSTARITPRSNANLSFSSSLSLFMLLDVLLYVVM